MLSISTNVQGLDKLQKEITRLEKIVKLQKDKTMLNERLAQEMVKIVRNVATQRLSLVPTSNEEYKNMYLSNNKYRIEGDKIIIYNDLCIVSPKSKVSDEYMFCIALAFEYGTGVIGKENPKIGAWAYDVNKDKNRAFIDGKQLDGWWIPAEQAGSVPTLATSKSGKAVVVQGYEGMEIYRFAQEEIIKQLPMIIKKLINE